MSVAPPCKADVWACMDSGSNIRRLLPGLLCLLTIPIAMSTCCRSIPVQKHLEKVYATLAAALVVAAFGAYVQILSGWSAGLIGVIGAVICMTGLMLTQPTAYNLNRRCAHPTLSACPFCAEVLIVCLRLDEPCILRFISHLCAASCRYALLAGAALCDGFVVGPLVDVAVGMNPAMVLTAFLATASIFACFSGAGRSISSTNSFQLSVKFPMRMVHSSLDMRGVLFEGVQASRSYGSPTLSVDCISG